MAQTCFCRRGGLGPIRQVATNADPAPFDELARSGTVVIERTISQCGNWRSQSVALGHERPIPPSSAMSGMPTIASAKATYRAVAICD
jgi:hypothetical protein